MKSKIVKKVLAASLATAMMVGMAGCGEQPTTNNDTPGSEESVASSDAAAPSESTPAESSSEPEEEVSPYTVLTDADGNVYDLGGMEIIVRDWWSDPSKADETNNEYEEARLAYRDWIQDTYNFTLVEQAISDWGSAPQDFVDYATTGGDENYVFCVRGDAAVTSAMNSGLMYDLATLDCLDFSQDKWKSGVHELMSKNGAIYAMHTGTPEPRAGIFFNKRLLKDAGIDPQSIYDLQENMEWTWDKFIEILAQVQRDTDNDGVIDIAGMTQNDADFYNCAVWSNGGQYIGMENGQYTYELESDETLEALNWAWDAIKQYRQVDPEGSNWDYYKSAFLNGEAVFCCENVYCAGGEGSGAQWETMEDEYGFVCFPMGPKMNDYTNCYSDNPYVIPACYDADKAWKLAFAYNLWTEPVPGYEDYEEWKPGYLNKFPDTEAVDLTIARMVKNGMVTYHSLIPNMDLGNDFVYGLNGSTVSEKVEAIRETWKDYVAKANE